MKKVILTVVMVAMGSIAAFGQTLSGNPAAAAKARQARKSARMAAFQPQTANTVTKVSATEYQYDDAFYGESNTNTTTQSGNQPDYKGCEMGNSTKTYKGTRSGGYGTPAYYARLYQRTTPRNATEQLAQGAVKTIIAKVFK
tara:strand:+ start:613 stop:1038 length:426 start_codon:yes stop_codon:yes gene_type:complete